MRALRRLHRVSIHHRYHPCLQSTTFLTITSCRWVQTTYGIPPGRLTEGTIENGHKTVKLIKNNFARSHSYKAELTDIMVGSNWRADLMLAWEATKGQQYRYGNIRKSSSKTEVVEENKKAEEAMDVVEETGEGDQGLDEAEEEEMEEEDEVVFAPFPTAEDAAEENADDNAEK